MGEWANGWVGEMGEWANGWMGEMSQFTSISCSPTHPFAHLGCNGREATGRVGVGGRVDVSCVWIIDSEFFSSFYFGCIFRFSICIFCSFLGIFFWSKNFYLVFLLKRSWIRLGFFAFLLQPESQDSIRGLQVLASDSRHLSFISSGTDRRIRFWDTFSRDNSYMIATATGETLMEKKLLCKYAAGLFYDLPENLPFSPWIFPFSHWISLFLIESFPFFYQISQDTANWWRWSGLRAWVSGTVRLNHLGQQRAVLVDDGHGDQCPGTGRGPGGGTRGRGERFGHLLHGKSDVFGHGLAGWYHQSVEVTPERQMQNLTVIFSFIYGYSLFHCTDVLFFTVISAVWTMTVEMSHTGSDFSFYWYRY